MEDFETDEAPEHDPKMAQFIAEKEGMVPTDKDWIAPAACELPEEEEEENCGAMDMIGSDEIPDSDPE